MIRCKDMIVYLSLVLGCRLILMKVLGFYDFPFPYWPDDLVTRFSNASLIIPRYASKSNMVSLNKEVLKSLE